MARAAVDGWSGVLGLWTPLRYPLRHLPPAGMAVRLAETAVTCWLSGRS